MSNAKRSCKCRIGGTFLCADCKAARKAAIAAIRGALTVAEKNAADKVLAALPSLRAV